MTYTASIDCHDIMLGSYWGPGTHVQVLIWQLLPMHEGLHYCLSQTDALWCFSLFLQCYALRRF
jgi:hypothetical protein